MAEGMAVGRRGRPGPLSVLVESLRRDDLAGARHILHRAPWTSLTGALRALPTRERGIAFRLLTPAAAARVLEQLTVCERAELRATMLRCPGPAPGRVLDGPRSIREEIRLLGAEVDDRDRGGQSPARPAALAPTSDDRPAPPATWDRAPAPPGRAPDQRARGVE